jgi:PEP-CTERM motif-containing protein
MFVGTAIDPSGDNEIYGDPLGGPYSTIVLDVSDLLSGGVTAAQFYMGSTTNGEEWLVWTQCTGTPNCWISEAGWSGTDEGIWHDLPEWGSHSLYAFTAGGAGQNVLLGGLSLTTSVPEPATWAMMLLGFGAMGVACRRRTTVTQPQIA